MTAEPYEASAAFRRDVDLLKKFMSRSFSRRRKAEAERDLREATLEGELGVLLDGLTRAKRSKRTPFGPMIEVGTAFGLLKLHMFDAPAAFAEGPDVDQGINKDTEEDLVVARCFAIAQRAVDDLRRYIFDDTVDRRRARAERLQSEIDALSASLGHDHSHAWPRGLSRADGADASLKPLEAEGASVLALLDASYDSPMDPVVRSAVFRSRNLIEALLHDARSGRSSLRKLEAELAAIAASVGAPRV